MNRKRHLLVVVSLLGLGLAGAVLAEDGADPADAHTAFDEEWSNRLMYQKAMIDKWRKRLDRANAAYARAVAEGEAAKRVEELAGLKKTAAAELQAAQDSLPRLLAEAREEGVSDDVLVPYRFAVSPADTP